MKRSSPILLAGILLSSILAADHRTAPSPLAVPTVSATETVAIYADFSPELYGRSVERAWVRRLPFSEFSTTVTFPVAGEEGFLTAVVADARIAPALEGLLGEAWFTDLGQSDITRWYLGDLLRYTYHHRPLDLEFTFSLERPGEEILEQVRLTYPDRPDVRELVLEHYRANYVIRIWSAENVTNPGTAEITYDEALLMATLIGEPFQQLWGIHDGNGILFRPEP